MVLSYGQERRLEANHIHFCGRSLHQPANVGLAMGMTSAFFFWVRSWLCVHLDTGHHCTEQLSSHWRF
jgi:hypothetical protein